MINEIPKTGLLFVIRGICAFVVSAETPGQQGRGKQHWYFLLLERVDQNTFKFRPPTPLAYLSLSLVCRAELPLRRWCKTRSILNPLFPSFFFVLFSITIDITSFIISLGAIYLSHRPSTATHTFGYHRAEVLGALFSIFLIWGLTLLLVMEAYDRVRHPIDIDGKTMSIIAGLGVCVNVV